MNVELHCKIVPAPKERGYKLWRVEIKNAAGELLRQETGAGGDTVRFKNLKPGIYSVCMQGEKGRHRCQSYDLFPAPGSKPRVFVEKLHVPPPVLNRKETHRVSIVRLSVPERARREMIKAEEAQLRGDKEKALQHLHRAIEIFPDYVDALNNLGTHSHRKGDYEESVRYFTKATKLDPEFFAGWVNLGGSLLAGGKVAKALEANRRAVKLRPSDPLANSQMGLNYYYMRNYREAKKYLQQAVSLDPSSANSPQLFLAHIAFAERRHEDAERHIRSYLDLHPHSPQAPRLRQTLKYLSSSDPAKTQESSQDER